jgi:ERCC4-type nuclease
MRNGGKPPSPREAAEAMLAAVPGISTSTVRALLAHFGSIQAVLAATPEEWAGVPNIGPQRVQALQAALRERFSS